MQELLFGEAVLPLMLKGKHVYIATGNLYSAPLRILQCQERQNNQTKPTKPDECVEPENHSNSSWPLIWTLETLHAPNCPTPDADFGEAPIMFTSYVNGTKKDMVVAVQKSGFAWVLDRNNRNLVWFTEAGPGGYTGGGTWGAATDERRVYIANSEAKNFTLAPSNMISTAGGWVAMDSINGKILGSTANPCNSTANGSVSVANQVLFAGSMDRMGSIYAINAKSGKILWSYKTGGSVYGCMSISNGCIYVGHG
ncbi:hypothetical protein VNO78_15051 [Psophocarpus tetragonolobus]|uniref:Pyrrolo-quinoline quinone repeat domain-containing protein n=1 Tax=Psophocarpus tetragonolobus TaxID=3891 RepID=A0AAN9SE82_PSOTE